MSGSLPTTLSDELLAVLRRNLLVSGVVPRDVHHVPCGLWVECAVCGSAGYKE